VKADGIIQYLSQLSKMGSGVGEYHQYLLGRGKSVECTPYHEVPGLMDILSEFDFKELKVKECWHNTWKLCSRHKELHYVDGLYKNLIPTEHAWCYFDGYYFDLTSEFVLGNNVNNIEYFLTDRFNFVELNEIGLESRMSGEYTKFKYHRSKGHLDSFRRKKTKNKQSNSVSQGKR